MTQSTEDTTNVQGYLQVICKDCGNGTLNNELNEAFEIVCGRVQCLNCGSAHVDVLTF